MRTTVDIDDPILRDLMRLQQREGRSLGRLVSDLLTQSLAGRRDEQAAGPPFEWFNRQMAARVDLTDKHTLLDAMDESRP